MSQSLVIIISALSIFNMLMLTVISWVKSVKIPSFFWLGWVFFPPAIAIINNLMIYLHHGNFIVFGLSMFLNVSWGSFFYLYIYRLRHPEKINRKFSLKLFIPSLVYFPVIIYGLINPDFRIKMVEDAENNLFNIVTFSFNMIICFYAIIISIIELIREFKLRKPEITELRKAGNERKEMLIIMLILLLAAFLPYILKADTSYLILYMPVFGQLFFIYMFFRLTLSQSVFIQQTYLGNASQQYMAETVSLQTAKYASIKIEKEKIDNIYQQILAVMEQKKPYLNMNFSLADMSAHTAILPNIISMVINTKSGKNFPDFINHYRIEHAIGLLEKPTDERQTIESIAYDSGFSNRTSFYNAFKKHTGNSPSNYIK